MGEITRREVLFTVKEKIGENCFLSIKNYLEDREVNLWGQLQPEGFTNNNLILCIYKDLTGIGYKKLWEKTKEWLKVSDKTLRHNFQKLRYYLYKWAKLRIILGNKKDWNEISSISKKPKGLENVNLCMDSSDFALRGSCSRKGSDYSPKTKCKGRRYQFISDANSRIRCLLGGYSPKVYDAHYVEHNKYMFEQLFRGAVIIADTHYKPKTKFRGVKFVCPIPQPPKRKKKNLRVLTKEQQSYNVKVHKLRARIENIFGDMKDTFQILGKKFGEGIEQLDYLVTFAAAVHNFNIK